MSAKLLRQKYAREFARMERNSIAFAWVIVLGYILQIILAVLFGGFLLSLQFNLILLLSMALIMLFIGTRFRGLNNIIHECTHATFCVERTANTTIGKFCAAILFNSFSEYRDEHLSHHAHLGDYNHDLDLQGIKDLKLHEPLCKRVVLRHILNPFLGRHLPYYLNIKFSMRDGAFWLFLKAAFLSSLVALIVIFPLTMVLFVVLPFALVFSTLNYWADCLDHAGIVASQDDLHASRNVLAPALLRSVFFPRNDCFHLVHHLFPNVPSQYLEASHKILADEPEYRACGNAVLARDLDKSWKDGAEVSVN